MAAPISNNDPFGSQTSGLTNYTLLANELIKEAFGYCGIALDSEGESINAGYLSEGRRSLNTMIAAWQAQGIHLWTYQEGILFLEAGINSYALENVRATNRYLQTTTTSAITLGGSTVDLTSVSELDADWWMGVMDSDSNIVWMETTDVTGSTVTIDGTWPSNVDSGVDVFYYQYPVDSVERLLDVRRNTTTSATNEQPVELGSHEKFNRISNKVSQGSVNLVTYDRVIPQGILYVYQTPQNSSEQIRFTYERKLADFVNSDDAPDFPKYWLEALTFGLARRLTMKYSVPAQKLFDIKEMAAESLNQALDFDNANYEIETDLAQR